jgi:hypothetical protein
MPDGDSCCCAILSIWLRRNISANDDFEWQAFNDKVPMASEEVWKAHNSQPRDEMKSEQLIRDWTLLRDIDYDFDQSTTYIFGVRITSNLPSVSFMIALNECHYIIEELHCNIDETIISIF